MVHAGGGELRCRTQLDPLLQSHTLYSTVEIGASVVRQTNNFCSVDKGLSYQSFKNGKKCFQKSELEVVWA
jgi:hypothetical protein